MKKPEIIVGIDIANESLVFSFYDGHTHQIQEIEYLEKTIRKTLITPFKKSKDTVLFVMEATGIYHTRLAYWLDAEGFQVSVVNPLKIKRYGQMHLMRIKTDSADAKLIAEYGHDYWHKTLLFKTKSKNQIAVDNLVKVIDDFLHQKTITSNQLHALKKQAHYCKQVSNAYKRHLKFLKEEVHRLEVSLKALLKKAFSTEFELLQSIPGIGLKVSAMIIAVYGCFKYFENAKQACSFAGIAPAPYESGTSIRGRGSISKRGNTFARKILFMGALIATRHNPLIKQQYQRLIQAGKAKMVAIIAAANKLLRQAFAVLKSGIPFEENYGKILEKF